MKYKDWLIEWLELYVKTSTKERTYRKYRQQAEKYILPALGGFDLNALSAVELQKFSVTLTECGLAPSSVNCVIAVLKSSLKRAVLLGVAKRQYSNAIVRPKNRTNRQACFSKTEQKKIEHYILESGKPHLIGILLSLYTGLRIGELLALTWEDVDFQRGTIAVFKSCHDSWSNGCYVKVFDTPKTQSSERVIPLPKQMSVYLKQLRKQTGARFVVPGKSEYGAEIRSYQRTFQNVLRRLQIEQKGFHTLRHTFATRALEVGMDVKTLSEILGHADPAITLKRYVHSLLDHKTEMMNRVGRLLIAENEKDGLKLPSTKYIE